MKIFISGTYLSSKDPGGKFWFQLQISKIRVWHHFWKALEPLFDLQEALGETSNLAPKTNIRKGNVETSSAPRWSDAPNLGAPKIFWEVSYTYILIIKRVFEVTCHFTFCWTSYMRFLPKITKSVASPCFPWGLSASWHNWYWGYATVQSYWVMPLPDWSNVVC